jgi:hypothetical protein
MPLDASGLNDDIEALAATPAADIAGCAGQWADAVQAFAASIVPASTTVAAAAATLEGALATAFAASAAAPGMESAFAAFAATVGTGMAPAFVATPPAGQVGFATQFLAQPATHALAAAAISGLIDTWMKTGSATPSGGGAPVPWT